MPDSSSPEVSIIMPAYNAAAFISESIKSIQDQTFENWELIVVDDGSQDQTYGVVESLAQKDERITVLKQKNGRQGKARNTALNAASGTWIAFLDADDLWVPEKLSLQMALLKSNPNVGLVYAAGWIFNTEKEEQLSIYEVPSGIQDCKEMMRRILEGWSLPIPSVLVNRHHLDQVNRFSEELVLQNAEDYQLWLKLADAGVLMYGINQPLFKYRVHPSQTTYRDGINMVNVIWALKLVNLRSVSEKQKRCLMESRLDRYLVHHIEMASADYLNKLMNLYGTALDKPVKGLFLKMLLLLGKTMFKKIAYKTMNLQVFQPEIKTFRQD